MASRFLYPQAIADANEIQLGPRQYKDFFDSGIGTFYNPNYYQRNLGTAPFPHTGMTVPGFMEEPSGVGEGYDKTDSNFFGIPSMFLNALNFRNPLSERSSNYNPRLAGQIEDLRNIEFGDGQTGSWLGTQSSPYQLRGGPLAGQNLVSMFGTNDYDEMLAKKAAWFQKRADDDKGFSQKNWDAVIAEIAARDAEKAARNLDEPDIPIGSGTTYTGPQTFAFDRGQFQREGRRPDKPGGFTDPGKGSYGPHRAQGGYMRSRYNKGGRVGILAAF